MVRKEFHIYGRVQGVGFRFNAARVANSLGLTGYAENLSDGSVCVQLQGELSDIDKAKEAILNPGGFIDVSYSEEKEIPVIKEYKFYIF